MRRNGNYHTQQQHTRVHHKILRFVDVVQFLWHILDYSWNFLKYLIFQIVIHFWDKKSHYVLNLVNNVGAKPAELRA
jgi:hypothetical protein